MSWLHWALLGIALLSDYARAVTAQNCNPSTFEGVLLETMTIEKINWVPDGGAYGESILDIAYPTVPTGLPELCAVTVKVVTSPSSSYRLGLFLPTNWKGNFLTIGNSGSSGGINWLDMAPGPHYGMATVSSDTGHNSNGYDASWALNNPETQSDWGWRAMHGSVQLAKNMTEAYYGAAVGYSYYSGCSTGGRQGLREIQEFADSFDGALIGSPAWYTTHSYPYLVHAGLYNLPVTDPKHVSPLQLPMIAAEVLKQCDGVDGLKDNIVSEPSNCKVDWTKIQCGMPGSNPLNCLNAQQIQTMVNLHSDYYSAEDGQLLHPGYELSCEEQLWVAFSGPMPSSIGLDFLRYFQYSDPTWDWSTCNESTIADVVKKNPGQTAAEDFDLSRFKARGSKLLLYHGMADPLIPFRTSQLYYNRTVETMGNVDDFFRFFPVPGMQHCTSTPSSVNAPWNFGGASQAGLISPGSWSVPGFQDSDHDALLALVKWVEQGKAVDSIVATTWQQSTNPQSGVYRQRPLCPFPKKATYGGQGDVNVASSWVCT